MKLKLLFILSIIAFIGCTDKKDFLSKKNNGDEMPIIVSKDTCDNYLYPFSKETVNPRIHLEIPITNYHKSEIYIPPLKYNKKLLFMITQDDCVQAAFSNTWAIINGKPVSYDYFYDYANLWAGDLPKDCFDNKKIYGITDGAGNDVRFSFTTTLNPESNDMNRESKVDYYSNIKNDYRFYMQRSLNWEDVREMLNYGVGITFHDVHADDLTNEDEIIEHFSIAQKEVLQRTNGRGMKMLAEPNGNRTYTNAAIRYDEIKTIVAQANSDNVFPYVEGIDLQNKVLTRVFYSNFGSIIDELRKQMSKPFAERRAIHFGTHRTGENMLDFFEYLESIYGKSGEDCIWVPSQEEYYEYNYYRNNSEIEVQYKNDKLVIDFQLPHQTYFYYPSISLICKGITLNKIQGRIITNDDITGLSYADSKDGLLINIDCRKYLYEHAKHFLDRYLKNMNESTKRDALYFISFLKDGEEKNGLLNQIINK